MESELRSKHCHSHSYEKYAHFGLAAQRDWQRRSLSMLVSTATDPLYHAGALTFGELATILLSGA